MSGVTNEIEFRSGKLTKRGLQATTKANLARFRDAQLGIVSPRPGIEDIIIGIGRDADVRASDVVQC